MPLAEVVKVFVLILVPVGIGMLVKARKPDFAARADKPVRVGSAAILRSWCSGSCSTSARTLATTSPTSAWSPRLFCGTSLVTGYLIPKAAGVVEAQAIASSMEIGVHNGTLAIFVAVEVLEAPRSRSLPRSTRS